MMNTNARLADLEMKARFTKETLPHHSLVTHIRFMQVKMDKTQQIQASLRIFHRFIALLVKSYFMHRAFADVSEAQPSC